MAVITAAKEFAVIEDIRMHGMRFVLLCLRFIHCMHVVADGFSSKQTKEIKLKL